MASTEESSLISSSSPGLPQSLRFGHRKCRVDEEIEWKLVRVGCEGEGEREREKESESERTSDRDRSAWMKSANGSERKPD